MHPPPPVGRVANALAGETSPYLLQHALNPVAWRPWGEAAIREARERDLPLFVSIGYSTCHWCHVMERESFESEAVAELLNRDFVPVKVDREERPDVDEVYMTACQAFTRLTEGRASGGWPLSAWVDPHSLKPFWVGTYFPPVPTHGRPSFTHMLDRLAAAWRERREEVNAQADRLGEAIRAELELAVADAKDEAIPFRTLAERAAAALVGYADFTHGGFGGAPKFPQPPFLSLVGAFGGGQGTRVVDAALDAMVLGGIHDQVGGGFHRYAVDASWTVPHFEKMLYDQALLLPFLARRAAAGDALHRHAAERLVAFLDRELTEPDGAFRSALDAEAGGREGEPYAWTAEAFGAAFGADEAALRDGAERLYGMSLGPNFRDPHHEDAPPMRVLRIGTRADAIAAMAGRDRFDAALLAARARRPQPAIDDKVIAAWNGLMIAGLAEAGVALGRRDWCGRAARALEATIARLGPVGSLRRTARAGVTAPIAAQLEDVGALALAAATLGEAGLARSLLDLADRDFAAPGGGWFDAPLDAGPAALFVRSRSLSDGAVPAGNTLLVAALIRLLRTSPDAALAARLGRAARAFAPTIAANPTGSALLLAELAAAEAEGLLPPSDADPCADGACRV